MSKKYIKPGELVEADAIEFDGVGYSIAKPLPASFDFKVNKYMLKQGYKWDTDEKEWFDPECKRDWVDQDEARKLYVNRKRWWRFWLRPLNHKH